MSWDSVAQRRRNSIGCLGVLAVLILTPLTVGLLTALLWMNPAWLEPIVWWRAPLVKDLAVTVDMPAGEAELRKLLDLPDTPDEAAMPYRDGPEWVRLETAGLSAPYDPATGGGIEGADGLALRVPAGALENPGTLTMTPVVKVLPESGIRLIGPTYDIRMGERAHLVFKTPATLSLPVLLDTLPEEVGLLVWENGGWVEVESVVNPEDQVITAQIDHASIWGVGMVIAGALGVSDGTVRAAAKAVTWTGYEEFSTLSGNFKFHYALTGPHSVPSDRDYLALMGKPLHTPYLVTKEGIPLYVQDLGYILEYCRHEFATLGLHLPAANVSSYDVFLESLGKSYGSSGLGGPMIISSRLDLQAAMDGLPLDKLIRSVCAHELVHVSQGEGYSDFVAAAEGHFGVVRKWWIEMCAEYLANFMWDEAGQPLGEFALRFQNDARLPATPMIGAPDPQHYAYASFFHWVDDTQGPYKAFAWIRVVDKAWWADPESIDAAARSVFSGSGLVDLFREFSFDFYNDDLKEGDLFPQFHRRVTLSRQSTRQSYASLPFMFLTAEDPGEGPGGDPAVRIDTRKRSFVTEKTSGLSAQAAYLHFGGLPEELRPKLVIRAHGPANLPENLAVYLSWNNLYRSSRSSYPFVFAAGGLKRIPPSDSGRLVAVLDKLATESTPDHATIVVMNRSLAKEAPSLTIERWLLLPPRYVEFSRSFDHDSLWRVRWPKVDLKQFNCFKTYRVYRKPIGASDEAFVQVMDTKQEEVEVDALDLQSYEFTVRVVDIEDNESHNAPPADIRFSGTWSGTVRMSRGSIVKSLKNLGRDRWAEKAVERFPIGEIPILGEMNPAAFLIMLEQGLKIGMPVKLEIREEEGQLEGRLLALGGLDYGLNATLNTWYALERSSPKTVKLVNPPLDLAAPELKMHRYDKSGEKPAVVRCDNWRVRIPMNPDGPSSGEIDITLSLSCTRVENSDAPLLSWLLK